MAGDLNYSDKNDPEKAVATEDENNGSGDMQTKDGKEKTNDTNMQQVQEDEEYLYDESVNEVGKYGYFAYI